MNLLNALMLTFSSDGVSLGFVQPDEEEDLTVTLHLLPAYQQLIKDGSSVRIWVACQSVCI